MLTPTDKAQNNISIICKKFYIESLLKEVSPDLNKNSTYLLIHEPSDTILNKHEKDIKTFGFQLPRPAFLIVSVRHKKIENFSPRLQ